MAAIELALGPCLFNWPADRLADFYARIADEAPVERVYVGEVVCGKRMPFTDPLWPQVIERLQRAGKTVVLSALALPATVRERKTLKDLAASGLTLELNDFSLLADPLERAFVAGPFLNVYNEAALGFLAARGASDWCPPVEVPLDSIRKAGAAHPQITVELFAFGRLPLALSSRCYHARAHGLAKDSCQFVCDRDPDGMAVRTLDNRRFLAVNGIQTLSDACQAVTLDADRLAANGIGRLRLSLHTVDMVAVARTYRALLDGDMSPADAESALTAMDLPGPVCNAYLAGEAGWRHVTL
ncbi:ubiquinone anaerobic biosynthesis protein UbiV [Polymorphum gilvum]|uniref:Ubiquinone biosynthesis protein UbiV n=1 Tax=Polymorphum gilvum (strain LMG 25793 / CGMCC 1.9160 / SL003B-26A1) TaxID=991905 RepID=F2J405_POLGS|nr:U32 family peptidase [Polymorphum gilvum]ADZ68987.1 Peptidase U32 [Polymorphum gilvum SL003B-26A1]